VIVEASRQYQKLGAAVHGQHLHGKIARQFDVLAGGRDAPSVGKRNCAGGILNIGRPV
jgi:hypothetical protein